MSDSNNRFRFTGGAEMMIPEMPKTVPGDWQTPGGGFGSAVDPRTLSQQDLINLLGRKRDSIDYYNMMDMDTERRGGDPGAPYLQEMFGGQVNEILGALRGSAENSPEVLADREAMAKEAIIRALENPTAFDGGELPQHPAYRAPRGYK